MTAHLAKRRGLTAGVLVVAGFGIAVATWAGGDHGLAVGLVIFYAVAAVIAYLWAGGSGDTAAIMRVDGDERQRGLDRDATAITGLAMSAAAIVGVLVQSARSADPGPYAIMCLVGGVTYGVSLAALRWRR
jgi:hypothetical protein